MSATKADEGSPSAPPAAVGPMTSLYPQLGPPPGATAAAPQPTLPLSSASTFAEAGVAPEMKARQVTPEDGAASPPVDEVAAPPPPGLSRTTTESMGVPPGGSSPSGGSTTVPATSGTAPAWPAISAHNGEGAARDAEMLSEADDNKMNFTSSTSSEAPKNHIGSTNQSSTKPTTIIEAQFSLTSPRKPKQQEQAPVDTSKDTSNAHGATTTSSGSSSSSSSAGSSPSNRSMAFHGTLCLNTNDLTDQDGTEDTEALAVFRDAIVSKTTGGGGADAGGAAASVAAASTTHAIAATTSKSDDGNMSTGSSSATAAAAEAEKPPAKPQIDVADTLLKQAQMVQAPRTVPAVEIAAQMMSNPSPPSQTALGQSISQTSQTSQASQTSQTSQASQTSQTSQASLQSSSSHSQQQQQQQHGQATMSAAGLAKRAQQQAVEAHIRAEAAIALAQQASELEAMERNLAVAEQGATSQAQMQAEIQQQQQLHSLMLEGLYPNISRGILASSTGAVASAAASPGTADGHAAVLSSLVESQRIREQLLAAEAEAAAAAGAGGLGAYHQIHPSTAAASLLDPSYYSQLLAASGGGHHPVLASAGLTAPAGPVSLSSLSSHMLQLQQLMAGSGAAAPAPSSASAHLPSGGNGDSLQRMVEQEEHELRALQLQLHQQQQQLSLRHHLGSGVGPLGGMGGMGVAVGGFGLGGTSMAALGGAIGAVGGASLPIHHAQQQQLQHPESVSIATTPAAGGAAASTSHNGAPASTSSSIPELKAKGPMKKRLKHAHDLEMLQNGSSAGGTSSKTMVTAQPKLAGAPMYQYTATLPPPPVPPPGYFPAGQPQQRLLLYSPEDHHWLSDQLCFVRKLIEIFEANEEDVTARSRRGGMKKPIKIGRVGLRCVFCSSVPARQRAKGAVSYPNSIRIVHQAIRNFQRYHLMQCPNMPQSIKDEYKSLKTTRCHSGNASLQYWVTSCHALGMCDTDPDNGIRLRAPPSSDLVQALADEKNADLSAAPSGGTNASAASASAGGVAASTFQSSADPTTLAAQVSGGPSATSVQGPSPAPALCQQVTNESSATFGPSLVLRSSSDEPTAGTKDAMDLGGIPSGDLQTTPYMSLILAQQRPTVYQPADSLGKRRPRPSGFPGMECKHCSSPSRVASPGRYFPLTTTVLANNNNPGGCVYVHLMKCGRCPQDVKVTLQRLAERHTLDGENLDRGWRRRLFSALWDRLHQGRVWDESELAEGEADESAEAQIAEESMEEDDHQAQDGDEARPAKEGGDDVGTAALALSALSGLAGKRKQPDDEEEDDDDL